MEDPELEAIRSRRLKELLATAPALRATDPGLQGPIHLTDVTFDAEVRKTRLVLVDFWAEWCGPCHQVAPVLDQIARERAESFRLAKLNIDENPRTTQRYGVMSIPTMLLFKSGKLVDGVVGAVPKLEIEALLNRWT